MKAKAMVASGLLAVLVAMPASHGDNLNIVNGGFETGKLTDSSFRPVAGSTDAGTDVPDSYSLIKAGIDISDDGNLSLSRSSSPYRYFKLRMCTNLVENSWRDVMSIMHGSDGMAAYNLQVSNHLPFDRSNHLFPEFSGMPLKLRDFRWM